MFTTQATTSNSNTTLESTTASTIGNFNNTTL